MTSIVAFSIFVTLSIVTFVHVYWGYGGLWPARDEASLVKQVIGTNDNKMPGRTVTLIVSLLIFVAGYIPMIWVGIFQPSLPPFLLNIIMLTLTTIFLGRGLISYTPIARKIHTVEPFASLNKRYYSPLCVALGCGFAVLLVS